MADQGTPSRLRPGSILRQLGITVGGLLVAFLTCLAILIAIGETTAP